jgi:hypothetical protein
MRDSKTTIRLGNTSEALVLTAFQFDGVPVALPFGCHERWDLVAKIEGRWKAVQVKTAHHNQTSGFAWSAKTNQGSESYTAEEIDLFVVVYPETGRMWRIPIADACGKITVSLDDKYLWKAGSVDDCEYPHPEPANAIPYRPYKIRKSYLRVLLEGHDLTGECPQGIKPEAWAAAGLHVKGMGLWKIARHYRRDAATIAEWMERLLLRLQWATGADLKRLTGMPKKAA